MPLLKPWVNLRNLTLSKRKQVQEIHVPEESKSEKSTDREYNGLQDQDMGEKTLF